MVAGAGMDAGTGTDAGMDAGTGFDVGTDAVGTAAATGAGSAVGWLVWSIKPAGSMASLATGQADAYAI